MADNREKPYRTADQVPPEECRFPEMHEMFRYCAYCAYREPTCGAPSPGGTVVCTLHQDHDGSHESIIRWSL